MMGKGFCSPFPARSSCSRRWFSCRTRKEEKQPDFRWNAERGGGERTKTLIFHRQSDSWASPPPHRALSLIASPCHWHYRNFPIVLFSHCVVSCRSPFPVFNYEFTEKAHREATKSWRCKQSILKGLKEQKMLPRQPPAERVQEIPTIVCLFHQREKENRRKRERPKRGEKICLRRQGREEKTLKLSIRRRNGNWNCEKS